MRDSGQFNYHLDEPAGHFGERTDAGDELRRAGQQIVRTVIAGTWSDDPPFERAAVDVDCRLCGVSTEDRYRDECISIVCTACDGFFAGGDDQPEGSLSGAALDRSGVPNREPEGMLRAAWTAMSQDVQSTIEGVCDACSGGMDRSPDGSGDHVADR